MMDDGGRAIDGGCDDSIFGRAEVLVKRHGAKYIDQRWRERESKMEKDREAEIQQDGRRQRDEKKNKFHCCREPELYTSAAGLVIYVKQSINQSPARRISHATRSIKTDANRSQTQS
jgi:hypothetical protein